MLDWSKKNEEKTMRFQDSRRWKAGKIGVSGIPLHMMWVNK